MPENKNTLPPVQIHFSVNFPVETRCSTSEEEPAIVEITKVEYSFEENAKKYDVTFFISGIKSFSVSDDDQECFIRWCLKKYGTETVVANGMCGTGNIEMGERFDEKESVVRGVPEGVYTFEIIYV